MKKRNNLIVFATYWNEIDWVRTSLKQIEELNPKEIIICDGCFDDRKVNRSTDGTRDIIKNWIKKRDNATLISAIRVNKFKAIKMILKGHNKLKWYYAFTPARFKSLLLVLKSNSYRVNQALTFQTMISKSKEWKEGYWTTNIDCDQFFSDEMLKKIPQLVNVDNSYGLLTGKENTFFTSFDFHTRNYEKREYNNMPHKIYKGTNFIPTRGTIIESFSLKSLFLKDFFKRDYYINQVEKKNIGRYNHYKFKFSNGRLKKGYSLGDRKEPVLKDYKFIKYNLKHPKIIIKSGLLKKKIPNEL
jgi:hypothetical protein